MTTVEALADMTPEQLEAIEGIGPKTVEKISLAVNNYFASLEGGEAVRSAAEGEAERGAGGGRSRAAKCRGRQRPPRWKRRRTAAAETTLNRKPKPPQKTVGSEAAAEVRRGAGSGTRRSSKCDSRALTQVRTART